MDNLFLCQALPLSVVGFPAQRKNDHGQGQRDKKAGVHDGVVESADDQAGKTGTDEIAQVHSQKVGIAGNTSSYGRNGLHGHCLKGREDRPNTCRGEHSCQNDESKVSSLAD